MHDEERSERPSEIKENTITAVQHIINDDERVTIETIRLILAEEHMSISHGTIVKILHDNLNLSKVCALWVPKMLTDEHRKQRIGASFELFTR